MKKRRVKRFFLKIQIRKWCLCTWLEQWLVRACIKVEAGSRIYQVIDLAGGLTEEADKDFLNMAQTVTDGQKIVVYTKEEVEEGKISETVNGITSNGAALDETKINLNTADKNTLMKLTGIGEAKADAILTYRTEHGGFRTIEEIMEVPGIKSAAFEKIKDDIIV